MKLSGMAWKATLQASQSSFQVLQLGPPSFLLHSSPDMLNNINIWRLCWPSLKDLEKRHSGTWGMARSSILLKNLTPLVVQNVLGGKNLLIFATINVTIHLTNLLGTFVLDVTPNHNLSTSKFWWTVGPDRPLRVIDNIGGAWDGAQLTIHLKNKCFVTFLLSKLPSGCRPWRTQYGFLASSCLALVSGQQYDRGDHCEQESDVQFLTKQASLVSTPPRAVRRLAFDGRTSKLSSQAVVLHSLPDLGLSWIYYI